MSGIETPQQRLARLLDLRRSVDQEIRRLNDEIARAHRPKITRRSRHEIPPCGTESAYQRHRWLGEQCPEGDTCKRAHARHTAETAARRRLLKRLEAA